MKISENKLNIVYNILKNRDNKITKLMNYHFCQTFLLSLPRNKYKLKRFHFIPY